MHIRTSRVRRNGKTYEYAQLVETYRRPSDGMPVHRVIATLGKEGDLEVGNMRAALLAARAGKRVVVARQAQAAGRRPPKPMANLRYLDLAVLLSLWRALGLDAMLDELMPQREAHLRPASVVTALVLQRCVDPGSKLYATRWFPRTALPELLNLAPSGFNNTRLHRVLDELDTATLLLMSKLPRCYVERDGVFTALFLDVSDAWFVGHGPSIAERGKTKEGMVQRKIGIVLLCNQHGLPLRWEVIPGTQADSKAMTRMLHTIAGRDWTAEAPVVCDRAMGKTQHLREMLGTGLRFLTALTVHEFDTYAQGLPHPPFAQLDPRPGGQREQDVEHAAQCALAAGLQKVDEDLYILDLGIVERADAGLRTTPEPARDEVTIRAMELCRRINDAVAQGQYASYSAAGRALGIANGLTKKYRLLGRLSEQEQRDVLDGKAVGCALADLIRVAAIDDADARHEAFNALLAAARVQPSRPHRASRAPSAPSPSETSAGPIRVRVVVYFNPVRFVEQRLHAHRQLEQIRTFVDDLNAKIAAPRSRSTARSVAVAIDRRLRQDDLLEAFDVQVTEPTSNGPVLLHVDAILDQAEWARRRRYDGFSVLVAHPEMTHSATELCRLYRAKDAVEKDFHIIKSVVQLRPVWHHDDAKVRAHVTLCMLALLLERTLHRRLVATDYSPEAALETLAGCHLNLYAGQNGPPAYTVTHLDDEQGAILRALRLKHLADDDHLADQIHPR